LLICPECSSTEGKDECYFFDQNRDKDDNVLHLFSWLCYDCQKHYVIRLMKQIRHFKPEPNFSYNHNCIETCDTLKSIYHDEDFCLEKSAKSICKYWKCEILRIEKILPFPICNFCLENKIDKQVKDDLLQLYDSKQYIKLLEMCINNKIQIGTCLDNDTVPRYLITKKIFFNYCDMVGKYENDYFAEDYKQIYIKKDTLLSPIYISVYSYIQDEIYYNEYYENSQPEQEEYNNFINFIIEHLKNID
jgi:hypothetical protein